MRVWKRERGERERRGRRLFVDAVVVVVAIVVARVVSLLPPPPTAEDLPRASDVGPLVPLPSSEVSSTAAALVIRRGRGSRRGRAPSLVRRQRRREAHQLPKLVVGRGHAVERRAAERAQRGGGGPPLLPVAEDEREAGDASLRCFDYYFFGRKRK